MAFDLYSGSTDFGHDNAVVPIVLPGVPGETSAIAGCPSEPGFESRPIRDGPGKIAKGAAGRWLCAP